MDRAKYRGDSLNVRKKATWVWKLHAAAGNPSFTCSLALFVLVFPAAGEELLSSQSPLHCSCGRKTTCCCCDAVSANADCFTASRCMTVWLILCLRCGPICFSQTCLLRLDDDIGWRQCFQTFCQTKKGDIFKGLGREKQKHFCRLCLWVYDSAHSERRQLALASSSSLPWVWWPPAEHLTHWTPPVELL